MRFSTGRVTRRNDLSHCAAKLEARGIEKRNLMRRATKLEARGIEKRNLMRHRSRYGHNNTSNGYSICSPASSLFASNNSCILTPEVTNGPYYVSGEYVRRDIGEEQTGVAITLDYQVVDVDTCEPVPNVFVEIWHCNATGVYSGVGGGQGGLDTTWLRGLQETDEDGVVQFESIFPGHYTGRATHIHVMVHANATLLSNNTIGHDNTAMHVGQAFFDQSLISEVEATSPYILNEQELTENADDDILAEEASTDGVDPLMSYMLLGSSVSDGLFAWLSFGVNTTYANQAGAAALYYEGGGVTNEDAGGGLTDPLDYVLTDPIPRSSPRSAVPSFL
ncbi:Intradiol ring-cleavage dioxygenase [Ilyonectria sp. MPI-CAGE-AT-0026]|nr:Intradiol ring-cleavage dioxygenase [Ilyonectria sp. MPI-CAGE-AT-0026]